MDKKKILILPNSIYEEYHNRSGQIALTLAKYANKVYLFQIDYSSKIEEFCMAYPIDKLLNQKIICINQSDELNIVNLPDLNCGTYEKNEYYSKLIENFVKYFGIEIIINSSFDNFSVPANIIDKIFYFYDISEDYLEIDDQPVNKSFIGNFIEAELYKAHYNITSSKTLARIYKQKYWTDFIYFPNAVDLNAALEPEHSFIREKLFKEYKITDESTRILSILDLPLYGRNLELIIKAFTNIRGKLGFPVKLLISTQTEIISKYHSNSDIIFSNKLTDEQLREHFIFSDIGAVPLIRCKYTDHALPIALIEYGIFKKITIATPTEELQHHHLPYIIYASPESKKWEDAIIWAFEEKWNNSWDTSINEYKSSSFVTVLSRLLMKGRHPGKR